MPLLEDPPKLPAKQLIFIGIPVFVIAVAISFSTHQIAHILANRFACQTTTTSGANVLPAESILQAGMNILDTHGSLVRCPIASLAGILWTFGLALASFAIYLRFPRNVFFASMAFVNASARIPETITVFLQLLVHNKSKLIVDESSSLALLSLRDPTLSTVIMCFFSLTVIFLTVTIVHDTKMVPWKWLVALGLFLAIGVLENTLWNLFAPLLA
ncbi:MAG: hypothetical protein HY707_08455 [Ignavibacteriae bacterium]|nr:hypothetical protein [Ignavibacteriota bacterium]